MQKHSHLYRAAIKHFPCSWAKALLAAGLNPTDHKLARGVWDRQSAEVWVRKQVASKKSVLAHDVPRALFDYVRRRLELGWSEFVEEVTELPYPGIKKRRDWTKDEVLSEIRRMKTEQKSMNYRAVAARGQAIIYQSRKFFGSWDAARAAAGV
jgi:hypothetical protein